MTNNMKRAVIVAALLFGLPACSTNSGVDSKVYAAEQSLTLAEQAYFKTCQDVPTLKICVDPLKQQIKDLDNKAFAAKEAAKNNSALLSFAISAIGEFTTATAKR